MPNAIGSLIARDLRKRIEEIIKVDQADEQSVYTEITEYIVTDRLREHYRTLLKAIAEAPREPHEGVGVWVSGFFGSGKSSFAKNLGYVLADRTVLGKRAAELMKPQLRDPLCSDLIDSINLRIPTEVVMFDVQTDRSSGGSGTASLSHYMYRSLLRTLDYAEDFDIAELEQGLEVDGRLDDFMARCGARFGDWRKRRKMAMKMNEASAILNEMDPKTYPTALAWAQAQAQKRAEITPNLLVERTFELMARRRPGRAVAYVVDEVGAYVARSEEKIEDLRAVVEQFGKESKNRLKAGRAVGPVWVVVTSQEKLDEVVAAIDSKRVQLARLQDRFRYRIDLAPADIREVATKRVLGKTDDGRKTLSRLYRDHEGQINLSLKLASPAITTTIGEADFVDFYPYPPHFIDLSIDIMSGIRLQPGAPRHLGGSNRTIIKQAFEMLVAERTALAKKPVGRLVTLDLVFELVEGNLSTEKQRDLSNISVQFGAGSWETRTAKAVTLLEFVRGLSRTEENLAAVLVDEVGAPAPLPQVRTAVASLQAARFIRNTEEGWKLQTQSEKSWETQRRSLDPKPRDRNEVLRECLADIFGEPGLKTFAYGGLRSFKVGLTVDGDRLEDGQIPLRIATAESPEELPGRLGAAQAESRQAESQNDLIWVYAVDAAVDGLVAELFRSRRMVSQYDYLRAQGKISPEESSCLAAEKHEALRYQGWLRERVSQALQAGTGFFRGVSKDGSALGKTTTEVFRRLFETFVPQLYAKLQMGSRPLKGNEADELLKAANLSGLPQVFYEGDDGLGLVVREGAKYVPNPSAPVAREILDFIQQRTGYGEKVSGKDLEQRFGGLGYGWERELIQLVLAALFRAGAVEVTYQGRRYRSYQDAPSRAPFVHVPAFRAATFSPRESIGLRVLTTAAQRFEEITGREVEIEETALAQELKKLAAEEHAALLPILANARAHRLPVETTLNEFAATLEAIRESPTDDCVRELAGQGKSLKDAILQARRIRDVLTDARIAAVEQARRALSELWPVLRPRVAAQELEDAATELGKLLGDPGFYDRLAEIQAAAGRIEAAYATIYRGVHEERAAAAASAMDRLKGTAEWPEVVHRDPADPQSPTAVETALLAPLQGRFCGGLDRPEGAAVCRTCQATVAQMESDLAAIAAIEAQIFSRLQELATPEQPIARLRVAELIREPLDTEEAIRRFVDALEAQLRKLLAEGARILIE
jgi:hypothetical protein